VNKELMTMDLLKQMNIAEKLTFIKSTQREIISSPDSKYRKLKDLLLFCSDPKDIDVVIKALKALCDVFCDILPGYRIRETKNGTEVVSEEGGSKPANKKGGRPQKVSKEVQQMREHE